MLNEYKWHSVTRPCRSLEERQHPKVSYMHCYWKPRQNVIVDALIADNPWHIDSKLGKVVCEGLPVSTGNHWLVWPAVKGLCHIMRVFQVAGALRMRWAQVAEFSLPFRHDGFMSWNMGWHGTWVPEVWCSSNNPNGHSWSSVCCMWVDGL